MGLREHFSPRSEASGRTGLGQSAMPLPNRLEFISGLGAATASTAGHTVGLPNNALFQVAQPIAITNHALFIRAVGERRW